MKKGFLFLFVFILIAVFCFFGTGIKQSYAAGEKKIILKGVIRGKGLPNFLEGANWVDVSGNYAYVVSYDDNSLSVFNISDPAKPALASSIKVQAYEGKDFGAFSVFVSGNFAYVYDDGGVLLIYDISDPTGTGPQLKGKVAIGPEEKYKAAESKWGGVYVEGILAYVVDEVSDGLTVLDVSDKAKPVIIGSISGAGAPNYLDNPCFVTVSNGFAYITSGSDNALTIIDIEIPKKPTFASVIKGAGEPNYLGGTNSVFVAHDYAYVAAFDEAALSIINVSNPLSPTFAGHISGKGKPNYLEDALDVKVVNNYAFVSSVTDNAISVYDVIDATKPVLVDVIKGSGNPNYLGAVNIMKISGSYLYAVSAADNALVIFDISSFTEGGNDGTTPESSGASSSTIVTVGDRTILFSRDWQREMERGAQPRIGGQAQPAAVILDDRAADGQADPDPVGLAGEKRVEHAVAVLGRNPAPLILDRESRSARPFGRAAIVTSRRSGG